MTTEITCPFCGLKQKFPYDLDTFKNGQNYHPTYCNLDEGGCDKMFIVYIILEPKTKIYKVQEVD
jgi:hypothetical protein